MEERADHFNMQHASILSNLPFNKTIPYFNASDHFHANNHFDVIEKNDTLLFQFFRRM